MRKHKKTLALLLVTALVISSFAGTNDSEAKKKKTQKVKVSSVKITNVKKKLRLQKGKRFRLKTSIKVSPNKKKYKKLKFTSSNKKVVMVNSKGLLKGRKTGTAKITVTSKYNSKKKAKISVTVTNDVLVKTIKLDRNAITVDEFNDEDIQLNVTKILPSNAKNKDIEWSSDNEDVADVDEDGLVSTGDVGTATITASAADHGGATATCQVVVTKNTEGEDEENETSASGANSNGNVTPNVTPSQTPDNSSNGSTTPTATPTGSSSETTSTPMPTAVAPFVTPGASCPPAPALTPTPAATVAPTPTPIASENPNTDDNTNENINTENTETMTLSSDTFLGSGIINSGPTYNNDGSVTFTAGNSASGGGIAFYLNSSKTALDLSDYLKVSFTVSATEDVPITLLCYTGTDYWSGRKDISYPTATTTQKTITYDIRKGSNIYGFGVKYNTNSGTDSLPETATITIHSITLTKDTRNITDATTNYSSLYELASNYGIKMGTVFNNSTVQDTKYANLMKYHFNSITAANEMKAYSMLNQSGSKSAYVDETSMPVINFTNADKIAQFAKDNNIKLRGHVLVWDADMCDWFFRVGYDTSKEYASTEVIKARMQNYIEQVLTHFETEFPGVIYCWDVVNEAVGDSTGDYQADDERHVRIKRGEATNLFYDHVGSDYVELAFKYAYDVIEELKETDPTINIDLYYNDYNTFYETKRDAICKLIQSINSYVSDGNGGYIQLCDGMGMQSYIGGYGSQNGCMNDSNITLVKTAIQKYADLGVDVQVTELAVRNYQDDDATQTSHGEFYKKLFEAYLAINEENADKPLKAVSIWGIIDIPTLDKNDYSYRMNGPYCGLFDENLAVKESFINVHDLLKGE